MTDDVWDEVVKGVKRIKTNIHVDDILPKEVEIRQDKEVTVSFDLLKNGSNIAKDDLSHMDGSLAKRFKREAFPVEGILDLHGVTEKDAFDKVCNFIKNSYFTIILHLSNSLTKKIRNDIIKSINWEKRKR
jgi:DNA-nicking Smr family endonuclease